MLPAMREGVERGARVRVLHVAEALGGGVYEMVRIIADAHAAQGHEVALAYGVRPETPEDLRSRLHQAVELFPTAWTRRTGPAQVRAALELARLAREWHPQVVHLHSTFAGVIGSVVVRKTPTIYTPNAYALNMRIGASRRVVSAIEAFASRRVTLVGAVSHDEAAIARRLTGRDDVLVVANGIPELDERVRSRGHSVTPALVVAGGRTLPQRQPEACARIMGAVRDVSAVEWIGGSTPDSPGARTLEKAGVPITGWLPRDEAQRRLAAAGVYLHWTAWDGLPFQVLEAIGQDVVVVASDIGPNREVLGAEQVCRTEEGAVALIRRVLADAAFAERLRESQRERGRAYGARRMVDEWLTVYRRLAAGSEQQRARHDATAHERQEADDISRDAHGGYAGGRT